MIAAYRMKGLGWFASCVAIVLGFYLVSLQVAAERKKLERMNAQISAAERDIRALETEFDTRANLAQLERWNGDTLSLAAPVAGQYVADEAQLAALDVAGAGAQIQTAALVVPSAPAGLPVAPTPVPAAAPATAVAVAAAPAAARPVIRTAAPVRMALATPPVSRAPATTTASRTPRLRALEPVSPRSTPALARLASAQRASAAVAKVRPQAVAMLDSKLLSDSTMGDILTGARAEAGRRR